MRRNLHNDDWPGWLYTTVAKLTTTRLIHKQQQQQQQQLNVNMFLTTM
jgi:hypothetical protein